MTATSGEGACGECGAVVLPDSDWCVVCGARISAVGEAAGAEPGAAEPGPITRSAGEGGAVVEGSDGDGAAPGRKGRSRNGLVAAGVAVAVVAVAGGFGVALLGGGDAESPSVSSVARPVPVAEAPLVQSEPSPAGVASPAPAAEPPEEVAPQEVAPQEVAPPPPLADPGGSTRYVNSRFGYSLDVPVFLVGQGESGNSDGQTFLSADGQTRLAVWGGYNATEDSVQEAFNRVLAEAPTRGRSVTHQASTPTKYTVSGYEANGDIYYVRSWLSEGREVTMEWEYPSEMQPIIGPAIQQAADTFRVGPG